MQCEVRAGNGYPCLYIDGKVQAPILFFGNTDHGKYVTAQAQMAAKAGIHLHSAIYNLHFEEGVKPVHCHAADPRVTDEIGDLERCLDLILAGDPEGKIFLRVKVGAYFRNPPPEWEDQIIRYADGTTSPPKDGAGICLASTSSDKWVEAVDERLRRIVTHMLNHPAYREHIVAIHLENCEWFEYGFRESGSDCSPPADARFIAWQKARYGDDYPAHPVPRDLPNNRSRDFYPNTLLMREDERRFIDYFDFINDLVSDRIEHFARTIKEASDNRLLVLAFYGYYYELADCQSGHYLMQKLLHSPWIDGFAGPVSYGDRTDRAPHAALGATSAYMTAVDSVARHGKLWFQESDQRTAINGSPDCGWLPNTQTPEDLYQIHRREVGDILLRGCGMWAMDLMDTGWLLDQRIWDGLGELAAHYLNRLQAPAEHGSYDVVLVLDERAESIVGQPSFNGISNNLISRPRYAFYRAGFSFAFAELQDVVDGLFRDGKLFVFLNPYRLSHETALALHRELAGKKALWMYGFGETASEDVELLTGFKIALTEPGKTAVTSLCGDTIPTSCNAVTHRYAALNGTPLGCYDNGACGFAESDRGWFFGGTAVNPAFLRGIARRAGIHVYAEDNDVLVTDGSTLVYCATEAGPKTVRWPDGRETHWEAYVGETRYFNVEK